MSNPIVKISPEHLEIVNVYLSTMSLAETAKALSVPEELVSDTLEKKEIKRYIDSVFLDLGYMNRFKLANLLEEIIEEKIVEAKESGMYTKKDLVDLLTLAHKMRMDEIKASSEKSPDKQVNIQQNNYGENYGELMKKLLGS